jgi:diguanylate cyclase (GGDEF)-like protein
MPRVLVVDDVVDNVDLLASELQDHGYEVFTASNGTQALEAASAERPDVILLDIMMPGMDGIEVCRRLKADADLRSIPVILVSALAKEADLIRGLDAGGQDYIIKPFNNRIAMARVRSAARTKAAYDLIAKMNDQLERGLERTAALRRIDQAINTTFDLRRTLDMVLDQVTTQLGADAADVLLCDHRTGTLKYATGRGFRTRGMEQAQLCLEGSVPGQVVRERRSLHLADLSLASRPFTRAEAIALEGFRAYSALPLVAKGLIVGVLEVFHRAPKTFEPEALGFLEALAEQSAIIINNASLFEASKRSSAELTLGYAATIEGWSHALDMRDKETTGHSLRVTEMTLRLARALEIGEAELVHIRRGALLHDIGKMAIPDSILLKPGPLTEAEWVIMRRHPSYAHDWLAPIPFLRPALEIPHCHHEKWDGSGYPRGLEGEQIPLSARIFAAVDIWDALRSDRPYRKAWPDERVRAHIVALSGTHLDPRVVAAFLPMIAENIAPTAVDLDHYSTTQENDDGETMQALHQAAFAALLYRAGDFVVLLDGSGRIQAADLSFVTAFTPGRDPRGLDFIDLLDSGSREKALELLDQPLADAWVVELNHHSPPTALRRINYSVRAISAPAEMRLLAAVGRDEEESLKLVAKVLQLNQQLEEAQRTLSQLALSDPLTGLGNRRWLFERLDALWSEAARHGWLTWIMLADLDHFKDINDTYGHQAGDEALLAISRALRATVRTEDLISRYGGEEFVLAGKCQHKSEPLGLADRLRAAIRGLRVEWLGHSLCLTTSIGIVVTEPDLSNPPWVALQAADRAMYRAKLGGRDRSELESGVLGRRTGPKEIGAIQAAHAAIRR